MNKRFYYILAILVILVGMCVWEQVLVNNYLTETKDKVYNIMEITKDLEDINTTQVYDLAVDLEETWGNFEENLCFFVNHGDIEDIGIEITKMKVYILENDAVEFRSSLAQILYFAEGYDHVMGITLQNIL